MTTPNEYVGVHRADETDLLEILMDSQDEYTAIDGCDVEPDGECEHGYPSWPMVLGLI